MRCVPSVCLRRRFRSRLPRAFMPATISRRRTFRRWQQSTNLRQQRLQMSIPKTHCLPNLPLEAQSPLLQDPKKDPRALLLVLTGKRFAWKTYSAKARASALQLPPKTWTSYKPKHAASSEKTQVGAAYQGIALATPQSTRVLYQGIALAIPQASEIRRPFRGWLGIRKAPVLTRAVDRCAG